MKATGVVRRIDDLGRIVIPKEIRKTLKIRCGDQLEIGVDNNGLINLKKFSPLGDLSSIASSYIDALRKIMDKRIIVTDMEKIIANSKELNKKISDLSITKELYDIIIELDSIMKEDLSITIDYTFKGLSYIKPITAYGDVLGCVIVLSEEEINDTEIEYINVLSSFFENYLLS